MSDLLSRPDTAAPAPPPEATAPPAANCPRCQGPMSNVIGIGWCPGCGYCPTQEGPAEASGRHPRKPSKLGAAEFFEFFGSVPPWLTLLLGGVFCVVAVTAAANAWLLADDRDRAVWGLGQVLVGLAAVALAHAWAVARVPAEEVRRRGRGSWSLGGLWRAAAALLPRTRWPVNLLSWGLALVLTAVLFVGGFGWWVTNIKLGREKPGAVQAEPEPQP